MKLFRGAENAAPLSEYKYSRCKIEIGKINYIAILIVILR